MQPVMMMFYDDDGDDDNDGGGGGGGGDNDDGDAVSHGRACYSGRLLERSGNLLRITVFVEMLSPLFTINAWTKFHQLLLQPGPHLIAFSFCI